MTRYVAEIGSNHGGDFDRAIALIDAAAESGFTDAKTQHFRVDQLFAPEALKAKPELLERKRLEVPWEWHKPLANRCKEKGLGYGVTVFRADDVRRCAIEADWLKVSSYSILDLRLLFAVMHQPKPVVVSTGMATLGEVEDVMRESQCRLDGTAPKMDLTLLHCVNSYPAKPHEANLRSIQYMRELYCFPVGWSDHTCSEIVLARAEHVFGASMIEVHWDLDDCAGEEAGHSWSPERWARRGTKFTDDGFYQCDGKKNVKAPSVSEDAERGWRADPSDGMRPMKALRENL